MPAPHIPNRHRTRPNGPSRLSSVHPEPGIARSRTRPPHCLAGHPPALAAPTRRTLPVSGRLTLRPQESLLSRSRLITPAVPRRSQVSGGLRPAAHVASRSVPADPARMSGRHPGIVSATASMRWLRFRSAERRSSDLPVRTGLFALRPRLRRDSLASAYAFAPLVVELFPAAFCRAVPEPLVFRPGLRFSRTREVPTPAALSEQPR